MTYFTFLGVFLVLPLVLLMVRLTYIWRQGSEKARIPGWKATAAVLGIHVFLAVTWTTPWDNYLVATSVWWYDSELVNGMTIGYVPIEEYTFFVLQPLLTGFWLIALMRHLHTGNSQMLTTIRTRTTVGLFAIWIVAAGLLFSNFNKTTYLALELVWALPPIMLQTAFGADILRKHWRLVSVTILTSTLYLSAADALAIRAGTWTIDPAQSTGILIAGILPVEELVFFLLTNILIVFGVTLALAEESTGRIRSALAFFHNKKDVLRTQNNIG